MTAPGPVDLGRHELLWVVEQCGGDAWPYPLRRVHWAAETAEETTLHRARTEEGLRRRGLLEPAPASVLLTVGTLVRDGTVQVDLVHRSPTAPRAAVATTDGTVAALLVSTEHADAPVRVSLVPPDRLPEAVLATVPPAAGRAAGALTGPTPIAVPTALLGRGGTAAAGSPTTLRTARARDAAALLVDTATAWGQAGVAARRHGVGGAGGVGHDGEPVRVDPLVTWLDGPRGRHRIGQDHRAAGPHTSFTPIDDAGLAAHLHSVLTGAAGTSVPRPPGRSTA